MTADDGDQQQDQEDQQDQDHYPREYVQRLRGESQRYRHQARTAQQRSEELAQALWRANVTASGRLADPEDLAMPADADPTDTDAINAEIDSLLERKPHLAARRASGDLGQHERTAASGGTDLAAMLRRNA